MLRIKNFPDPIYRDHLKARARRERGSAGQEATCPPSRELEFEPSHSIVELQGYGKEVWEGIEARAHVEAERKSWD